MRQAAFLALVLLAPAAMAHGQSIEVRKDAGRFHVIFYSYDFLTASESARLAWNVTDRDTQQRVAVPNATLVQDDYNTDGKLIHRSVVNLTQKLAGFMFTDSTIGPEGRDVFTVTLPPGATSATVTFETCVYPASTPSGGVVPRDISGGCVPLASTPLESAFAFVAIGAAAFASARNQVRSSRFRRR